MPVERHRMGTGNRLLRTPHPNEWETGRGEPVDVHKPPNMSKVVLGLVCSRIKHFVHLFEKLTDYGATIYGLRVDSPSITTHTISAPSTFQVRGAQAWVSHPPCTAYPAQLPLNAQSFCGMMTGEEGGCTDRPGPQTTFFRITSPIEQDYMLHCRMS